MASKETMKDYKYRTLRLHNLMIDNYRLAITEIVIKDSPVDYETFQFICRTLLSTMIANTIYIQFWGASALKKYDDKLIEGFHKLEEELAAQNEFLDKFLSKQTVDEI